MRGGSRRGTTGGGGSVVSSRSTSFTPMHRVRGSDGRTHDIRRAFAGNAPRDWQRSRKYGKKLLSGFRALKKRRMNRMKRVNPLPWMRKTPKRRTTRRK